MCIYIRYIKGVSEWYKLEFREVRCFVSRDVTFDETQIIIIMCKDLRKVMEKVHVKVEPSNNELGGLEILHGKVQQSQPTFYFLVKMNKIES